VSIMISSEMTRHLKNSSVSINHVLVRRMYRYCATFELTDVHSTCRKMAKAADGSATRDSDEWLTRLVRGAQLCVECQSFAMQRQLGSRCRGHGVLNRQTAWKAVTVPGCHGKWKLVTQHTEQCSCNPLDRLSFTFV
jgi:hypothetical protein